MGLLRLQRYAGCEEQTWEKQSRIAFHEDSVPPFHLELHLRRLGAYLDSLPQP